MQVENHTSHSNVDIKVCLPVLDHTQHAACLQSFGLSQTRDGFLEIRDY